MSDSKKHLERQLENPEFEAEWERQRPEREYIKAILQQIAGGVGKTLHIEFR